MAIELDHILVPSRDRVASAKLPTEYGDDLDIPDFLR